MNDYMLVRTLTMFEYTGLPETIPSIELERQLQTKGYSFITEWNGELYAFNGGMGGLADVYGRATSIMINNPALQLNKELDLLNDGVLVKNDNLMLGVTPIFEKYHSLMIENEITMHVVSHLTRIPMLLSAGDDATKESAEKLLEKIIAGDLGVVAENRLFEGIKTHVTSSQGNMNVTQLIELNQYLKASLYGEIGLNANFNMKRERLNTSEIDLNKDILFPFVDNMLTLRKQACEELNNKYGLSVSVEFDSSWDRSVADSELEEELDHEAVEELEEEVSDEVIEEIGEEDKND